MRPDAPASDSSSPEAADSITNTGTGTATPPLPTGGADDTRTANLDPVTPSLAEDAKPPTGASGLTRDASVSHQESPFIPDALRESGYRSSVLVRVEIARDGSFTVALGASSGMVAVDALVLESLRRWRWNPALKNGVPVASSQQFRLSFAVN